MCVCVCVCGQEALQLEALVDKLRGSLDEGTIASMAEFVYRSVGPISSHCNGPIVLVSLFEKSVHY